MKQVAKIVWIIVGVVFLFVILVSTCSKKSSDNKEPKDKQQKQWSDMSYEERDSFLNKSLENRDFVFSSELEHQLREAIKKECVNPKTVNFTISPSIYNGFANVVEADSGWIYVPFKCTAKNDFGVEKEIAGSVMYLYKPETNSLEVKQWDMNQNN